MCQLLANTIQMRWFEGRGAMILCTGLLTMLIMQLNDVHNQGSYLPQGLQATVVTTIAS